LAVSRIFDERKITRLWQVLMGNEYDRRSSRRSIVSLPLPLLKKCGYFVGLLLLFAWNWQLMLATIAGIASMWLVYYLQGSNWQSYRKKLQQFWDSCDRRLTVAIASGGLATLATYTAAAIWEDTENPWLTFGSIVQALATIATLLLVLWQLWGGRKSENTDRFDTLLTDLASGDRLKCLIAIRKSIRLVDREHLSCSQRSELVDYFRILLSSEDSPTMKAAILDGLAVLEIEQFIDLPQASPRNNPHPLEIPLVVKATQEREVA
jgi:hypothetical protein